MSEITSMMWTIEDQGFPHDRDFLGLPPGGGHHHEQLGNARSRLVPLAKKRAELDLASYAAGKLDLGTALLSTLALAEAEVDALAREAEVARDAIRINFIYGETAR